MGLKWLWKAFAPKNGSKWFWAAKKGFSRFLLFFLKTFDKKIANFFLLQIMSLKWIFNVHQVWTWVFLSLSRNLRHCQISFWKIPQFPQKVRQNWFHEKGTAAISKFLNFEFFMKKDWTRKGKIRNLWNAGKKERRKDFFNEISSKNFQQNYQKIFFEKKTPFSFLTSLLSGISDLRGRFPRKLDENRELFLK